MPIIYNYFTRLDESSNIYWAKMPHWKPWEAVVLSMGYDPHGDMPFSKDNVILNERQNDYSRRELILTRAEQIKQIIPILFPTDEENTYEVVYSPVDFSDWANKRLPSFPQDLLRAVMNLEKMVASKNTLPDFIAENIQAESAALAEICSSKSTEPELIDPNGKKSRWDKREPLLAHAIKFMQQLLDVGCCCNHEKLAAITYAMATTEDVAKTPIRMLETKGMGLKRAIKLKAKEMTPTDRHFGGGTYNPEASKCSITDHRNFKLQRHRD